MSPPPLTACALTPAARNISLARWIAQPFTFEQKAACSQRKCAHLAEAVFEPDDVLLALDDRAAELARGVFDDQAEFGFDHRDFSARLARGGQDVVLVAIHRYEPLLKMLTAREMTSATVTSEIADCIRNITFAQRDNGIVSVGLNAVALVNDV